MGDQIVQSDVSHIRPSNITTCCQWYAEGGVGWDQMIAYVTDELQMELDWFRLKLAKRVARGTSLEWEEIAALTEAPPTACRQAVIDARFPPASLSKRRKVLGRDGHQCCQCGGTKNVEVDHIIPRASGGGNDMTNLQALCHRCNVLKGSVEPEAGAS